MGGSIAFEMMRQAPDRIQRLALVDTSALPDTPEQSAWRLQLIAMAQTGGGTARLDRSVDFLGKSTFDLVKRAAIDPKWATLFASKAEQGKVAHCVQL